MLSNHVGRAKKDTKLAMLQPGRMLMPGDLQGAPLLLFFPISPKK